MYVQKSTTWHMLSLDRIFAEQNRKEQNFINLTTSQATLPVSRYAMDIDGIPWNYFHGVFGRNFLVNPCNSVKTGGKTGGDEIMSKTTAFYGNVPPNSIN